MSGYRSRRHLRIIFLCTLGILALLLYNDILSTRYFVTLDVYVKSSIGKLSRAKGSAGSGSAARTQIGFDADPAVAVSSATTSSEEDEPLKVYRPHEQDFNFTFTPVLYASDRLDLESRFNVCLATQTTIDRLGTINLLASYWRGPVELVIFLRTIEELTIVEKFLAFVSQSRCSEGNENEWLLRTVNIQLAYKTSLFQDEDREYVQNVTEALTSRPDVECTTPKIKVNGTAQSSLITSEELVRALIQQHLPQGPDPKFVYPQNHMRNRAKHACAATYDWVTVLDVDIVPKKDSATALQQFYASDEARACHRCAFVIPIYELAKPCKYPETKAALVDLARKKKAIPFHFGFWKPAHQATNYDRWTDAELSGKLDEGPVHISHETNYTLKVKSLKDGKRHSTYFYEPFYIAPSRIPDYPERFLGFGFTRSTQAFLSLVKGWKFVVLSPSFVTHCGIQPNVKKEDFKTVPRYQQVQANNKIYKGFVDELLKKYGNKL